MKYLNIFGLLFFFSVLCFAQTTYYVSSSNGNDTNIGTTELKPWETIKKLNSVKFQSGDKILFNTGDSWIGEQLLIQSSGTSNNPIVYSSYGDDNNTKPLITLKTSIPSNWKSSTNWSETPGYKNVWQIQLFPTEYNPYRIRRIWVDDIEYLVARNLNDSNYDETYGVNEIHRFYFNSSNNKLYIYAESNPANFNKIEYPGGLYNSSKYYYTIYFKKVDNIIFDGLEIEGGLGAAVYLNGSNYIKITNSSIGKYSQGWGVRGELGSDYITISNNIIDSGYRLVNPMDSKTIGIIASRGVGAEERTSYWSINNNFIKDWVWCVAVDAWRDYSKFHKIYNNEMTSPSLSYAKAIQFWGNSPNNKTNSEFYNNYIHDFRAYPIQICASNVKVYFNIIENVRNSLNMHNNFEKGGGIYGLKADVDTSPENVHIFNNTIYNTYGDGIRLYISNNFIANNLIINSNTNSDTSGLPFIRLRSVSSNSIMNNVVFGSGLSSDDDLMIAWKDGQYKSFSNSNFNSDSFSGNNNINGNLQYIGLIDSLINISTKKLSNNSIALNNGADISQYIHEGFKDRNGNVVDRYSPNIGALGVEKKTSNTERVLNKSNLKVFLEGPYNNEKMSAKLKIPSLQPYKETNWNYVGDENFNIAPPNLIDWVLIDLRSSINDKEYIFAALLLDDGSIVNEKGEEDFSIHNIVDGEYYIVINHRNHLPIISSEKVNISNSQIVYNFSDSQSKVLGDNSMKNLGDNIYGMYSGDSDGNGMINNLDFGNVANNILSDKYESGDLDLNGVINVLDYSKINSNIFKKSVVSQ